jgi:hypothetical protein
VSIREPGNQNHCNHHDREIAQESDTFGKRPGVPRTVKVMLHDDHDKRSEIGCEQQPSDGFDCTHTGDNGEAIPGFTTGSRTTPEPGVHERNR